MQRDSHMGGRVQGRAHQPLSHRRSSIQRVACWTVSAEPNERISVKSIRQENLLKMRLLSFREKDWNASKCVFSGSFSFWERSSRLFEEGDHILLYWKDSNGLIQIEREREQTSDRERGRERDRKKEYEKTISIILHWERERERERTKMFALGLRNQKCWTLLVVAQ